MKRIVALLLFSALLSIASSSCDTTAQDYVANIPGLIGQPPCMYSGFADISSNKHMFYWYFKHSNTTKRDEDTPVLVWLNGGPGSSSMTGLFNELGPLTISRNSDNEYEIKVTNKDVWTINNDVVFIDNPVGTGFSYTSDFSLIPENEDDVGKDLYHTVQYILKLHPETQKRDWYYSGESYAGKYIPAMAYWTLKLNDNRTAGDVYVPLKGMLVGDGLTLPIDQRPGVYDEAIGVGLLTDDQKVQAKTISAQCQTMIGANKKSDPDYIDATTTRCNDIVDYIGRMSGNVLPYDVRYESGGEGDINTSTYKAYLNSGPEVLKALHLEKTPKNPPFQDGSTSAQALLYDIMHVNSLSYINYVASRIPSLIYEGNMDMQDGSVNTVRWLDALSAPYGNRGVTGAKKFIWYEEKNGKSGLAGWVQQAHNLTFLTIAFSGHYVPTYQPSRSVLMVDAFTSQKHQICDYPGSTCKDTTADMCSLMNNCNSHGTCNSLGLCECDTGFGLADCSVAPEEIVHGKSYFLNEGSWSFHTVDLTHGDVILSFTESADSSPTHVYVSYTKLVTDIGYDAAYIADGTANSFGRKIYLQQQHQKQQNSKAYISIQNADYFKKANFKLTLEHTGKKSSTGSNTDVLILAGVGVMTAAAAFFIVKRNKYELFRNTDYEIHA